MCTPTESRRLRRAGVDVSAYMWHAALEAADLDERVADIFADIDARIEAAEREPAPESCSTTVASTVDLVTP